MKWWGYVLIVCAIAAPFYIYARRQDIKGAAGCFSVYRAVRAQKYFIKDFAFSSGGETFYFDYLVVNASGVFALSLHNLKGRLTHYSGRIYIKGVAERKKTYKYLNPVPHDVRMIVKLNAYVPEKVDIIPVIVFPRGNDKKLRAMWITPVKELAKVFSEPCAQPLTDREVENIYYNLNAARVKDKNIKKRQDRFIKRHCPKCDSFIYDAKKSNSVYLRCGSCSFTRDLTAAVIRKDGD